jgi:hypothetical protein
MDYGYSAAAIISSRNPVCNPKLPLSEKEKGKKNRAEVGACQLRGKS